MNTDSLGGYSFLALPVGHYRMEVKAHGFQAYERTDITLDANDALRFDIALELGQVTESVKVSTSAVHVETVNTQIGDVISGSKMDNLPLNGRSYLDLLGLQPGVVPVSTQGTGFGGYTGGSLTGNISISGQRETANGFEVNGGNVEEARNNGAGVIPDLDSIAEFRVLTNNADAEYGHYNGGMISVVTKSGTNRWHGDGFEFLRNEKMDSRNFYELNQTNPVTGQELPGTARGEFRRNQFGGTLGGPIKRDRAFFFADYEGRREILGTSTGLVPVPTVAERGGDLSANAAGLLAGTVGGGLASPYFASVLSKRLGYTVTSGEPYYTPGCTSSSQCVFPNGIMPPSAFDPAAAGMLQFIPLPNVITTQGAFFSSSANAIRTTDDHGSGRVDVNSGWGLISGYYYWDRLAQLKPFGDNPVPGFPTQNGGRIQQFNVSDTKTFGGNAVNELRFNLLRYVNRSDQPTKGLGVKLSTYGFQEGVPGGFIPADPSTEGVPAISISGGPSFGLPGIAYNRYQTNPQVRDIFSKVRGTHTVKFGGEYHYTNFVQKFPLVGGNGFISFGGSETGSGLTDYLIGAPSGFTQETNINFNDRKNYGGLFAQDSWRARPNLTINYGLRWELVQPWYERFNQKNAYVLGAQSTVFPTAPVGDVYVGDSLPGGGKVTRSVARFPKDNLAARIGIAYSPSGSGGFWQRVLGAPGSCR